MALPELSIVLTAATEGFTTALNRAVRTSATASAQIQEHAEHVSKAYERTKQVVEAAAAALAVEKFVGIIEGSLEAAQKLDRLSQSTGIAVEKLGGLGFAAKLADVDIDAAAAGFVKLDKSIAAAAAGNKEATAVYSALGISVRDVSGKVKGADDILVEAADKFAAYEDGANKTALAIALFGKRGSELIPLLNQGGEAIRQNTEYFLRYSGVTQELTEKAAAFEDTQKKISLLSSAFGNYLTADLLPAMQAIADKFLAMKENGDQFKAIAGDLAEVLKALAVGGTFVAQAFDGVIRGLATGGKNISAILSGTPQDIKANFSDYLDSLGEAQKRYSALREAINAGGKEGGGIDFGKAGDGNFGNKKEAPSIPQAVKEVTDPFQEYLDNLNKEGLKFKFDTENFDRFKAAAGTSKEALVQFDVEFGKFSDAARREAGLTILTPDEKQRLVDAGKEVAKLAEALERVKALHAFDESIIDLKAQTDLIGQNNEQVEIATRLRQLEKSGIKNSGDTMAEYQKRVVAVTEAVHQQTLAQQGLQLAAFKYVGAESHDEQLFQLSLIGKTRDEIQDLTAARQIDLNVRRQAYDEKGDLIDPTGNQLRLLQEEAQRQKTQVVTDNTAQRAAERSSLAGAKSFFNDYVAAASDAASQVRNALTDAFSAAEDAFVAFTQTGKFDFKSFVSSVQADLARITFKGAVSQGLQGLQGIVGGDSFLGKALAGVTGAAGNKGAADAVAGGTALTTFSTNIAAANGPLFDLSRAAEAASYALGGIGGQSTGTAASGGSSGLFGGLFSGLASAFNLRGGQSALGSTTATAGGSINASVTDDALALYSANGNVFKNNSLVPFAGGGVITSPIVFPLAGGRRGVAGEAGAEAIMPLKRGSGGRLGVELHGAAATGDTYVANIVNTYEAPPTRQSQAQAADQYNRLLDKRRRTRSA